MLPMIYLAILLIILVVMLLVKIDFRVEYRKTNEDDRFRFSILKRIIKYEITLFDVSTEKETWGFRLLHKIKTKKEKTVKPEETKFLSIEQIKKYIENVRFVYSVYGKVYKKVNSYLRRKIVCHELIFKLDFGLGDAAVTGVTTGAVWGTAYNLLSVLHHHMIIKKTDIRITPDFNDQKMEIRFYGIFTVKIVNIIIVLVIAMLSFMKVLFEKKISLSKGIGMDV